MNNTQYMSERFDALETKVDNEIQDVRADISRVYDIVDGIASRLDHDDTERTAMSGKLDRHDHWIKQLADHSRVKLEPQG